MKGQISVEMVILIALVLTVVAIVGFHLMDTAKHAMNVSNKTTNMIFDKIENVTNEYID